MSTDDLPETRVEKVSVDILCDKHESYPLRCEPVDLRVGGQTYSIEMPVELRAIEPVLVEERGGLLLLLGRQTPEPGVTVSLHGPYGVLIVAVKLTGGTYAVRIWHELFPWTLGCIGLETSP